MGEVGSFSLSSPSLSLPLPPLPLPSLLSPSPPSLLLLLNLKLSWILDLEDRRRHRYLLLSLGNEGKVLIWECQPGQKELKLLKGFRLLTENVPRSLRVGRAKSGGQVGGKLGGAKVRRWDRKIKGGCWELRVLLTCTSKNNNIILLPINAQCWVEIRLQDTSNIYYPNLTIVYPFFLNYALF